VTSDQTHVFGHDGHGSVRVLYDSAASILQLYAYSSYGEMLGIHDGQAAFMGIEEGLALTILLYSGEPYYQSIAMQYLRARFYDPATGRFNRLDPFAGNMQDPQSLHKYLYVHGDPVQGIDPTGTNLTGGQLAAIGVAAVLGGMALTIIIPSIYGRFIASWGINPVAPGQERDIAILRQGDLGAAEYELGSGGVSLTAFVKQLRGAGHNVTEIVNPSEQQTIDALNANEIVVILGHGPNDNMDASGTTPFSGIALGGQTVHPHDNPIYNVDDLGVISSTPTFGTVPANYVTANELQNSINNPNLVVVAPGCNAATTNRLYQAINPHLFVGSSTGTNSTQVRHALEFVADLLNEGEEFAKTRYLPKSQYGRINPTNNSF
jgi:RHS repeat-associated protein